MTYQPDLMQQAIAEAITGVRMEDGGPFGAVVVREHEIVATGHNMVLRSNDPTAHAEVTAIRNACTKLGRFNIEDCALYTSCYPCPMCMGAVLWAGIKQVYYAATSKDAEEAEFGDRAYHDFLKDPESGTLTNLERVDCADRLKPFQAWLAKDDRHLY